MLCLPGDWGGGNATCLLAALLVTFRGILPSVWRKQKFVHAGYFQEILVSFGELRNPRGPFSWVAIAVPQFPSAALLPCTGGRKGHLVPSALCATL